MNILIEDIKNVISNNNIDKDIEIFWIDFKKISKLFINDYKLDVPINEWSQILNSFKEDNDIDNIFKNIQIFISLFSIYIFEKKDSYYTSLIWSHVKKWKKINKNLFIYDKYFFSVSNLLLEIFNLLLTNNIYKDNELFKFFKNITISFSNDDMYTLIDLLVKYKYNLSSKFINYDKLHSYYLEKINF